MAHCQTCVIKNLLAKIRKIVLRLASYVKTVPNYQWHAADKNLLVHQIPLTYLLIFYSALQICLDLLISVRFGCWTSNSVALIGI